MAHGNNIIVTGEPKGNFLEGVTAAALYPGICLSITAFSNNIFTFNAFQPTDGHRRVVLVLIEDKLQGRTATTQYASGDRCFVYAPLPGDELNMRVGDVSGTADDHAQFEQLMIDSGTGELVAESSPEAEPFMLLETITDPTADTLAHCMFTGY